MGKRIIQQARGKGGPRYRVRRRAYRFKIGYPQIEGKGKVIKLIHSTCHTAPIAKIMVNGNIFFNPATQHMAEGQEIEIGFGEVKDGNILHLKDIPLGKEVYNIEITPGDGGRLIRTGGSYAVVSKKVENRVALVLPSKKEKWFEDSCRATIGRFSGHGRLEKPFMKAGKKYFIMKSRNKLWPRTSAVKMNAVDHPFGSGRGKRIKSKIAKNMSPPGSNVGHLHPKRTGRAKK